MSVAGHTSRDTGGNGRANKAHAIPAKEALDEELVEAPGDQDKDDGDDSRGPDDLNALQPDGEGLEGDEGPQGEQVPSCKLIGQGQHLCHNWRSGCGCEDEGLGV